MIAQNSGKRLRTSRNRRRNGKTKVQRIKRPPLPSICSRKVIVLKVCLRTTRRDALLRRRMVRRRLSEVVGLDRDWVSNSYGSCRVPFVHGVLRSKGIRRSRIRMGNGASCPPPKAYSSSDHNTDNSQWSGHNPNDNSKINTIPPRRTRRWFNAIVAAVGRIAASICGAVDACTLAAVPAIVTLKWPSTGRWQSTAQTNDALSPWALEQAPIKATINYR